MQRNTHGDMAKPTTG